MNLLVYVKPVEQTMKWKDVEVVLARMLFDSS